MCIILYTMPIPKPKKDEKKSDFVSRCMSSETMKNEFPDQKQRVAVCISTFAKSDKLKSALLKAARFPSYEKIEEESKALTECKGNRVNFAIDQIENECNGLISREKRYACIESAAEAVCRKHNQCAVKLKEFDQLLNCRKYTTNSVNILIEQTAPKLNDPKMKKTNSNVNPTDYHVNIMVGSQPYKVAISDSEVSRKKGLMFRQTLSPQNGMLFIFDETAQHSMWMKNVNFPLDIIWINENFEVVENIEAKPCQGSECPDYTPSVPAKYVLEVLGGTFEGGKGTKLRILNSELLERTRASNKLNRILNNIANSKVLDTKTLEEPSSTEKSCRCPKKGEKEFDEKVKKFVEDCNNQGGSVEWDDSRTINRCRKTGESCQGRCSHLGKCMKNGKPVKITAIATKCVSK